MSTGVPATRTVNPLLASYLAQLQAHPLRTKAITSAALSFCQEVLGSFVACVPVQHPAQDAPHIAHILARGHINLKALKMALYGFLVSAPLGHYLVGLLQKAFAGRTGPGAKVLQILASNLLVAPIQTVAFLASMAIINGAKTKEEVIRTVKAGFTTVIKITWMVSPLSMTVAQKFIPVELWVPFFSLIQFGLGTYFNAHVKKMKMAALKKKEEKEEKDN